MKRFARTDDLVARACQRLGRQNAFSAFLDWVACWAVPAAPRLVLAGPGFGTRTQDLITGPMRMASGPDLEITDGGTIKGVAATPHTPTPDDLAHATNQCAPDKYHGMHGRPCNYLGATDKGFTDLKCPPGTTAGWFWRYKTKDGVYYYVDCCGKTIAGSIWCNWSNEADWCIAAGDNHGYAAHHGGDRQKYTCTLAIPDRLMKTAKDSISSGGKTIEVYHVVGVD